MMSGKLAGKKSSFNPHARGIPGNTKHSKGRQNGVYMSFWTKEKQVGVWNFKGKYGNSQGDKKMKYLVNKHSLGDAVMMGHRAL